MPHNIERKFPNIKRNNGIFYHFLVSHNAVGSFLCDLGMAYKQPEHHNKVLVSIAEQYFETKGYLSKKQFLYALQLINKRRSTCHK